MTRRNRDAIAIQDGAVNPSAIANSIVNACAEIRAQGVWSTRDMYDDPAIRLMVHQLAYLCGIITGAEEFPRAPQYSECMTRVRNHAIVEGMKAP